MTHVYGNDEYLAQVERSRRKLEARRRERREAMRKRVWTKPSPVPYEVARENHTIADYADVEESR